MSGNGITRSTGGHFSRGTQAGPGRPKGAVSGRLAALQILDEILGTEKNKATLRAALQTYFDADPVKCVRVLGFPMLPQTICAKIETGTPTVSWVSLLDQTRLRELAAIGEASLREKGLPVPLHVNPDSDID
jgi:hypothetical protein